MHLFQDFSTNDKPVMSVYDNHLEFLVGDRDSLSFYDIENLNIYYQCLGRSSRSISGHLCSDAVSDVWCFSAENKCQSFSTKCQNDGFVAYVSGNCKCVCPLGLTGDDCSVREDKGELVNTHHDCGVETTEQVMRFSITCFSNNKDTTT